MKNKTNQTVGDNTKITPRRARSGSSLKSEQEPKERRKVPVLRPNNGIPRSTDISSLQDPEETKRKSRYTDDNLFCLLFSSTCSNINQ